MLWAKPSPHGLPLPVTATEAAWPSAGPFAQARPSTGILLLLIQHPSTAYLCKQHLQLSQMGITPLFLPHCCRHFQINEHSHAPVLFNPFFHHLHLIATIASSAP